MPAVFDGSFDRPESLLMSLYCIIMLEVCMYPKLDQLKVVRNPHVVCITETWLDSTIMDSELYTPEFDIVRLFQLAAHK